MRIPQRHICEARTRLLTSQNLIPHIPRSIDTHRPAPILNRRHQLLHICTVALRSAISPGASRTGVRLDIEPDGSVGVVVGRGAVLGDVVEVVDALVHLGGGVLASAREEVHVGEQSGQIRLFDVVGGVGVDGAVAVVGADYGEVLACGLQAGVVVELAIDIHSEGTATHLSHQSDHGDHKDWFHVNMIYHYVSSEE
jgi:hypothetical protein